MKKRNLIKTKRKMKRFRKNLATKISRVKVMKTATIMARYVNKHVIKINKEFEKKEKEMENATKRFSMGERVKRRREELGLSRSEVEEMCNYTPGYMASIEEDKVSLIGDFHPGDLADCLMTTVGWILGWEDEVPPTRSSSDSKVTRRDVLNTIVDHITEDQLEEVIEFTSGLFKNR